MKKWIVIFILCCFGISVFAEPIGGLVSGTSLNIYIEKPSAQVSSSNLNVQLFPGSHSGYVSSPNLNVYLDFDSIQEVPAPFPPGGVGSGGGVDCVFLPNSYLFQGVSKKVQSDFILVTAQPISSSEFLLTFVANCGGMIVVSPSLSSILVPESSYFSQVQSVASFMVNAPVQPGNYSGSFLMGLKKIDFKLVVSPRPYLQPTGVFALTAGDLWDLFKGALEYGVVCFGQFGNGCFYRFDRPLTFPILSETIIIYVFHVVDLMVLLGAVAVLATRFKNKGIIVLASVSVLIWVAMAFA